MSGSNNRFSRAAGGALAFGVVLCLVALALVRFDVSALGDNVTYEEKFHSFAAAGVQRIEIADPLDNILVSPSPDGEIHVSYTESEMDEYVVDLEDGVLKVRYKSLRKWYDFVVFDLGAGGRKPLQVQVPAESALALWVEGTNGQVIVNGLTALQSLEARNTNGIVYVYETQISGDLHLSTTNGDVTVRAVRARGGAQLGGTNGAMQVQDLEVEGNLSASTTNGGVSLSGVRSGADVTLSTSNGEIHAVFAGAADEYRIDTRTTNGSVDAPQGNESALKKLTASTTNGSVTVRFEG